MEDEKVKRQRRQERREVQIDRGEIKRYRVYSMNDLNLKK